MVDASTGIFLKPAGTYRRGRSRNPSPEHGRASSEQLLRTGTERTIDVDETLRSHDSIGECPSQDILHSDSRDLTLNVAESGSSSYSPRLAGDMALASGKSLGKIVSTYFQGILVDMPLATAEGFHNMPRLWGSEVRDYGKVTDWKSGGVVAGRSLIEGVSDGFRDMVMEPKRGGQEEGAWGATKGVAKGTASLLSKTISGGLGLIAYPGQGLCKSAYTLFHSATSKKVVEARRVEGQWMLKHLPYEERQVAVDRYYTMQQGTD